MTIENQYKRKALTYFDFNKASQLLSPTTTTDDTTTTTTTTINTNDNTLNGVEYTQEELLQAVEDAKLRLNAEYEQLQRQEEEKQQQ